MENKPFFLQMQIQTNVQYSQKLLNVRENSSRLFEFAIV